MLTDVRAEGNYRLGAALQREGALTSLFLGDVHYRGGLGEQEEDTHSSCHCKSYVQQTLMLC